MNNITITLRTGEHCIETSAKIELRKLTDLILESDMENADADMEQRIELLLHFLENSDFNMLRASDERFAGITPAECTVKWDENNRSIVLINE